MIKTIWMSAGLVLALAGLICFPACEKNDQDLAALSVEDYFVFGRYFGHCRGEQCIEIFKLEKGKLYEDVSDIYPSQFYLTGYEGEFKEIGADKYKLAKDLPAAMPEALFAERDTTIGMPDAGDWGGIYIETLSPQGKKRYWFIDNLDENLPDYLKGFVGKVRTTVDAINQE